MGTTTLLSCCKIVLSAKQILELLIIVLVHNFIILLALGWVSVQSLDVIVDNSLDLFDSSRQLVVDDGALKSDFFLKLVIDTADGAVL